MAEDEPLRSANSQLQGAIPIQETEGPKETTKILYRYVIKDENGDILEKKESPFPINTGIDDKATGLTEQTVLEVITTQTVAVTIGRRYIPLTVVKIHSLPLINALREVIRYYPGLNLSGTPVTIESPFMPVVHYMEEIENYKSNHPSAHDEDYIAVTNSHIDVLLEFLEQRLGPELRLERERHQRQPPVATFEYLWLLFRPGDKVFVVHHDNYGNRKEARPYVFAVMKSSPDKWFMVWNVDIDGSSTLGPSFSEQLLEPFEGEKEILSLPICPRRFLPDYSEVEAKFIARGKRVISLFEPSYMEYSGTTIGHPSIEVQCAPQLAAITAN
jgi:hypothetical protein